MLREGDQETHSESERVSEGVRDRRKGDRHPLVTPDSYSNALLLVWIHLLPVETYAYVVCVIHIYLG